MTSLKDIKEQIIKIKTDITDIDIAESKIQLKRISLQLNSREREKEPTEPKRGRRNLLNSREREGTYWTQEREKEPTKLKREREGTNWTQEREKEPTELKKREKEPTELKREGEGTYWTQEREIRQKPPQTMYYSR